MSAFEYDARFASQKSGCVRIKIPSVGQKATDQFELQFSDTANVSVGPGLIRAFSVLDLRKEGRLDILSAICETYW